MQRRQLQQEGLDCVPFASKSHCGLFHPPQLNCSLSSPILDSQIVEAVTFSIVKEKACGRVDVPVVEEVKLTALCRRKGL